MYLVRSTPSFIFIVFKKLTFYQNNADLFKFFAYILVKFHKFLQIITNYHKLKKFMKKIKNLTSKNLLKITFLKKIKNLTSMHGSMARLLLIF